MKQQVFKFCAHAQSYSPLLSWSVAEQKDNGDYGAEKRFVWNWTIASMCAV